MRRHGSVVLPVLLVLVGQRLALAVDLSNTLPVAPGVTLTELRLSHEPWEIRVLRVERGGPFVGLDMALGQGQLRGVEPLRGMAARETRPGDEVVAGVNADFFLMAGNPFAGLVSGLAVRRGQLVMTGRGRPAFALQADGTPRVGPFATTGTLATPRGEWPLGGLNQPPVKDALTLYTAPYGWPQSEGTAIVKLTGLPLRVNGTWTGQVTGVVPPGGQHEAGPDEVLLRGDGALAEAVAQLQPGDAVQLTLRTPGLPDAAWAVGGSAVLMQGGRIVYAPKASEPRHPRTAVGSNARELIFVTVDGRQTGWSVGMTLPELAVLMQRLGCRDALNLDGGGSTTAWVRGEDRNRPSDGGERKIANAVLIRSRAPHGPLARLYASRTQVTALSGARVPLRLLATDAGDNPVPWDPASLQVSATRTSGVGLLVAHYANGCLRLSGSPGTGRVRLALPASPAATEIVATIRAHCPRLEVLLPARAVRGGEHYVLQAVGVDEDEQPIWLPEAAVTWEGDGVTADGRFTVGAAGSSARLRATCGKVTAEATVAVAK